MSFSIMPSRSAKKKKDSSQINDKSRSSRPRGNSQTVTYRDDVINLTEKKRSQRRANKKAKRKPFVLIIFALIMGLGLILLLEDQNPEPQKEGLIFPKILKTNLKTLKIWRNKNLYRAHNIIWSISMLIIKRQCKILCNLLNMNHEIQ
ncbi:MAG: hypothetical protein R2827_03800 [Bdellovibrionales bacterium]